QVADAGGGVRAVALPFLADPDAAAAAADRRAVAAAGDHLTVVQHQAVGEIDRAVGRARAGQRAAAPAPSGRDLGPEQVALLPVGEHGFVRVLGPEAPSVVAVHANLPGAARRPQRPSYVSTHGGSRGSQAPFNVPVMNGASARKARPRWLIASLASAVISAVVCSNPSGRKIGSYPNPPLPRGTLTSRPSTRPVTTHSRDPGPGTTSAAAQTNCAPRRSSGPSATCARTRSRLARSSPCPPAQRADSTPGMPPSASTHRPESSATAGRPVERAIARAFSSAFSSNVAPVSATSGAPGNSSSPASVICVPPESSAPRIRVSSRSLAALLAASTP